MGFHSVGNEGVHHGPINEEMETLRMGYHQSRQNEDQKRYSQEIEIVRYSCSSNRNRGIWPVLKGSVLLFGPQLSAVIRW